VRKARNWRVETFICISAQFIESFDFTD